MILFGGSKEQQQTRSEKTVKTRVFRRCFTSARNTRKTGGENGDLLLAKKRLVKLADVLRQNTMKFKAVLSCFIVVLGRLRWRFRRSE